MIGKHSNFAKIAAITSVSIFALLTHSITSAQTYNIQKRNTEFSIDGNNGAVERQQTYLWATDNNNINQQWKKLTATAVFIPTKKNNTGMCLDGGAGGARKQAVVLVPCSSDNQNQHWRKVSSANDSFRLEKRNAAGFSIDGNHGGDFRQSLYLWNSDNNNIKLYGHI